MSAAHGAVSANDPYVPGHGNGGYSVGHYDLELDYRVPTNRLVGRARISAVTTQALSRFSLDLAGLDADKVSVNGTAAAKFSQRAAKLHVTPVVEVPAGAELVVEVRYSGRPAPVGRHGAGAGWEELADGVVVAAQPDGAPSWFPCNDHPADKASYQLVVTADSPYTVVANGTLLHHRVRAGRTRWTYQQVEPMPTYLATVQIGRYELVRTATTPVPQTGAVPPRLRARFDHDFGRQQQMITLFSDLFGPYPFPGYTVVVTDDALEIPVEAQAMSTFGANHVDGHRGSERLVAHELAHQWFGNSLTVARWQHIWLNEGFACYAEWLWSEASGGPTAAVLAARAHAALATLPQDLVIADPGPELMFDDRVYQRGALTLHALRAELGDAEFFALLQAWTGRYRHATVTTEAFVALAQERTARSVTALFTGWLHRPTLPAR